MRRYGIGIVVLGLVLFAHHASALDGTVAMSRSAKAPQRDSAPSVKRAVFAHEHASADVRHIADWVVDSGDNRGLPFVVIDKTGAKMFVFDAGGRLRGAAPVLLGLARGDHTVPGIGDRQLSKIRPDERTTPAGRFVAARGMSTRGVDVVWVDYDSGVSLHRVVTSNRRERRLERLATPTPADNRISYGCINVPVAFYDEVLSPSFGTHGIVYVLPETRPAREVFGSYDVAARYRYAVRAPQDATIEADLPTAE